MNKILLISIICTILTYNVLGQDHKLSKQELRVIKSYQFDLANATPINIPFSLDMPKIFLEDSKIEIDLLPIVLKEVTYSIKPLAHQPEKSKYYWGYAKLGLGTSQILDVEGSYRHQVPNYFMYGIDLSYQNIADKNIQEKEWNKKFAKAFLRYYIKPSFWLQYKAHYNFTKVGVFGFESIDAFQGSETKREEYRRNSHKLSLFKRFKNFNTDVKLDNTLLSARNTKMNIGENLISNHLEIISELSPKFSLNIISDHKRLLAALNNSELKYLWNNEINISFMSPKMGVKIGGLASTGKRNRLLPQAQLFLTFGPHNLQSFYKNVRELNTFYSNQDEINLIFLDSYNSSISENSQLGIEYTFDKKGTLKIGINAADVKLKNEQVWTNEINNPQFFSFSLMDYSYYDFGFRYEYQLLNNLSFSQDASYKKIHENEEVIPHFQKYKINNAFSFTKGKIDLSLVYIFGDKVQFTSAVEGYDSQSGYEHNLGVTLEYHISNAVNISMEGIDLLNNRFEAFTGYQDFGRRIKFGVFTKF